MSDAACLAFAALQHGFEAAAEASISRLKERHIDVALLKGETMNVLMLSADEPSRLHAAVRDLKEPTRICGVEAGTLAFAGGADAPACFVDLVLDPADPPLPFDDPTTTGIFQDYQRWYLPLLGDRLVRCAVLWQDGVRAAGSLLAFTARSGHEAGYLASLNPWHRVAEGRLLRSPPGVVAQGVAPPGPGTQRMHNHLCGEPDAVAEPGTAAPPP
jgi:hypothetical protein